MHIDLRRVGVTIAGAVVAVVPALALTASPAQAQATSPRSAPRQSSDSGPAVRHDLSRPLREIHPAPFIRAGEHEGDDELPHPAAGQIADPVVQGAPGEALAPTPTSFDGIGQGFSGPSGTFTVNGIPPDTNAAVGTTQVVEIVNSAIAVFNKSGTVLLGPVNTNTLFNGFGGSCQSTNDGDGVVRYDRAASRWIITQFANVRSTTGPYFECVAVSQTNDATGAYFRYSFQYANFPDYPKLGVWPDAYYITYNLFNPAGTAFLGAEVCALDRGKMLTGAAATQQCFTTDTNHGGLLPSDLDSATAPPSGAPNILFSLGTTSTTIDFFRFHIDFVTPANTTFTGPNALTVASYTTACGSTGTCIPQTGGAQLDSLSDRLMFRAAYRNFGDHQSVVVNHSVTAGSSVGVRWYEFRISNNTPSVFQQSTYAPDATFRWMGSIAMDKAGGIGLGFSTSSASTHPGIHFTGRLAGDTLNTMTQGEGSFIEGPGSQTQQSRWGDYASMQVDPADDCTFWYAQEYIPANGSFNWHTRLGHFVLPGCAGGNDFSISVSPTSGTVNAGGSTTATVSTAVTSGSAQTVNLSASGLPSGATASFSPSSVTAGGSSTLTIATSSTTAGGSFPVTITGTGSSATHSTTFTLTVNGAGCSSPGQKIVNPGFENGTAPWSATAGVLGNTSGQVAHGGTQYAWLDGYGTTHTDTLSQGSLSLPAGCSTYTLSFWLHIDSAETTTTTQFDVLRVQIINSAGTATTIGTFSNLNKATGYIQRSFNVGSFAGQTVTLRFTGTEDSSLQTSFVIDDTALNVS
jgi:hypothetical protein